MKYVYGPVPSRRLGLSLGISPIPQKACNFSCIYCQLGKTRHMENKRQLFFPLEEILAEFETAIKSDKSFDVITIVGEGEPTLYSGLGEIIASIKEKTEKPLAVITNSSLFYEEALRKELLGADIVLPTLDAYDEESFKKINRPYGTLSFKKIKEGLKAFSQEYKGQIWLEIMLMEDINDDAEALLKYAEILKELKYDRLYLNTPIRPPAEVWVKPVNHKKMAEATELLGGISIDLLASRGFKSEIKDDYEAILSIIKRHPMNQYEIKDFLTARGNTNCSQIFKRLKSSEAVTFIKYRGYETFRLK